MDSERTVATALADYHASMGYPLTATSVDQVDISAPAESLGCESARVDSVAGLEKALSAAFAGRGRPLVIEARVGAVQYSAQF
jgi:thiamine pyrophosphate-dependent acetolactate synthase large subunit-like protein